MLLYSYPLVYSSVSISMHINIYFHLLHLCSSISLVLHMLSTYMHIPVHTDTLLCTYLCACRHSYSYGDPYWCWGLSALFLCSGSLNHLALIHPFELCHIYTFLELQAIPLIPYLSILLTYYDK